MECGECGVTGLGENAGPSIVMEMCVYEVLRPLVPARLSSGGRS